jgi:hypothetical protein
MSEFYKRKRPSISFSYILKSADLQHVTAVLYLMFDGFKGINGVNKEQSGSDGKRDPVLSNTNFNN